MAEINYLPPDLLVRLTKLCIDHSEKDACRQLEEVCQDQYKEACDHYAEMAVHVFGSKPETLLRRVRPREDEEVRKYRLDSFEPITKSTCKKALNVVHKIFNPDGYSIRFDSEKRAQLLKTYSLEEYPRFNSVVNYMANFVLRKSIADPNGLLLVSPFKMPDTATERIQPYLTCYASKDVHYIDDKSALLFEKYERGNRYQRWYYTYVDKVAIYYLLMEKTTADPVIMELGRYEHFRGQAPFWQLGGEYSDKADGLLESYFSGALPFWNEVIMDHSDLRGAIRMHMFPQKWEVADECDYVEDGKYACEGGHIFNKESNKRYQCPSCHGAGRKSVKGPYQTYWVSRDSFRDPSGSGFSVPFGYVEPGTEATKILKDERDLGLQKGLAALNMDVLNNIGTNQSGISKDIDKRTELKEFLQKIADRFFEVHFPNTFDWFAYYMFGVETGNNKDALDKIQPQIAKPTEFDVYSVVELTEQFKGAKQAQLNPSYLAVEQAEIQNKKFQRNPDLLKTLNMELELDRLAEVSRDDISAMIMNLTITKETAIIHDNIRAFVRRAIEEDKGFPNKKYLEKIAKLEEYAREVVEANKIHLDMAGIEGQCDSLDTPVDIEAEAKANLKGSVGGVQGLIQIQTSVAEGITDYEAAVTMLLEIYGFEDAKARAILGDKSKLEAAHAEKKANDAAAAMAKQNRPQPPVQK